MNSSNRNIASFRNTKSLRYSALLSVAALGVFSGSQALAAEATTSATATVIIPIAITNPVDLVFGKFAPSATVGTVIISTSGARTATGGVVLSSVGSDPSAARFDVTGDPEATYDIVWSGETALSNGITAEDMALTRISDLTAGNATSGGDVTAGTLGSGAQSIYLGGELAVAASQPSGSYSGSITVAVEYN